MPIDMPLQRLLVLCPSQHGPLAGTRSSYPDGDELASVQATEAAFIVRDALQELKPVQDGLCLPCQAWQGLGAAELGAVQVDADGALAGGDQLGNIGDKPCGECACA